MTKRTTTNGIFLIALTATLGLASSGCDGDDDEAAKSDTTPTHIEVAGNWENTAFGEVDAIDDASWSQTYMAGASDEVVTASTITKFDNAGNSVIVEDPMGKFGRWVWTDPDGDSFFYCMADYGLDSAEAAENSTKPADDSDPENGGCGDGGFPWTKLTKK